MKTYLEKLWLKIAFGALLLLPSSALAQLTPPSGGVGVPNTPLDVLIIQIINWILAIVALIAVIMLIYGGVRYIVSGGDDQQTTAAKNTILYAIVGLIVVGLSWAIVNFIVRAVLPG